MISEAFLAGPLDADSEGFLLLTSDGAVQAYIGDPCLKMSKTYWAKVSSQPAGCRLHPCWQP